MDDGIGLYHSSAARYGTTTVRVDGRDGDVVWGRFRARLCTNTTYCEYTHGRFAGELSTTPSSLRGVMAVEPQFYDQEPWPLCYDDAIRCFPSTCTEWTCFEHHCMEGTSPPTTCDVGQTCDRFLGCMP
jgi:hypothetical protein